jgi:hypothetical protein
MSGLDYTKWQRGKKENERILAGGGEFPFCKGLFPDCPETPNINCSMCRTCPKTEKVKKKCSDKEVLKFIDKELKEGVEK